jgi:hypothetical protein
MNGGNETSRGFHTGATTGDALHPEICREQITVSRFVCHCPGKYERWDTLFQSSRQVSRTWVYSRSSEREINTEEVFQL